MSTTPALPVVNTQVQALLDQLPDIRRADEEGVHQARVAMRRLREVLPALTVTHPDDASRLRKMARRLGRQLGRLAVNAGCADGDELALVIEAEDRGIAGHGNALASPPAFVASSEHDGNHRRDQRVAAIRPLHYD